MPSEPATNDRVTVTLPARLVEALGVAPADLEGQVSEALAVDLFRRGEVSAGRASELLGIDRPDFYERLARHGVALYDLDEAEAEAEIAAARRLASER